MAHSRPGVSADPWTGDGSTVGPPDAAGDEGASGAPDEGPPPDASPATLACGVARFASTAPHASASVARFASPASHASAARFASPAPHESVEQGAVASARDLAGALHEVSNALTVILGWIERAREARGDGLGRALDIAASRARDARAIVRGAIGAKVMPDAGDRGAPEDALGDLVEDAVTALEPEARSAGVLLRATVEPLVTWHLVPEAGPLVQVLTNLVLNAIAMSPRGGTVQISAAADGAGAVVVVTDEGPGVPAERRATLLSDGISTRPGGAGIGLRHSAALAASAGGELRLAPSERGARFEVRWPLAAEGQQPSALPRGGATTSRSSDVPGGVVETAPPPSSIAPTRRAPGILLEGLRVLLVEDDEAVVELLDTALTARGAIIVSVRDVVDLPGALASGPFHAALLDISPMEKDIRGTVAAVRSASPAARLIVMSGSALSVPALQEECGASWVRKPFEVREIVDVLAR